MKILIISNLYPPVVLGGYELACANVAHALHAQEHEILVLTGASHLPHSDDPPWVERTLHQSWFQHYETAQGPITEWRLHHAACSDYVNTFRVLEALRRFKPDVCYLWNTIGIGGAGLLDLLNVAGVPWAIHLMDRIPELIASNTPAPILSVFGGGLKPLFAPGLIIAMSENLLSEIEELAGISLSDTAEVIPGWLDGTEGRPHAPYLRDGLARFVSAGAIQAHKGVGLIVEAAALLHRQGLKLQVDIYGQGDVGTYVDFAKACGVGKVIRFLGPRSQADLLDAYADYDAFLFPTWEREPFGFAPIEAAGCATPPIMTWNCGASERLVDGVHCLKVERTVADLARAMGAVASGRVDLARMGRAATALVRSDLSLARCVERIEAALYRAAGGGWAKEAVSDSRLEQLAYLKHALSLTMRFG